MQEKKGVTHINMMDLLQQYAMGNGNLKIIITRILVALKTRNIYYR
jgi:hypothetical protein